MPELPEVETICQKLKPYLINKKIIGCLVKNGSLRYSITQKELNSTIKNKTIIELNRRGKYILLLLSSNAGLCMHLGMTGTFRIVQNNEKYLKHEHISIFLKNNLQLRYCDPRRFGLIVPFNNKNNIPLLANLGVEPLGKNFNKEYIFENIKNRNKPIKNLIMDNNFCVGIGNIYASESLFLAKISPFRPSNSLKLKECKCLYQSIITILTKAIKAGGSTIKDYRTPDGQEGYFKQQLNVYDRQEKACNQCSLPIFKKIMAGRSTYYCPKCQK